MEQDAPKILHLSYRESASDNEYKWLYVNLVFKVTDEYDTIACNVRAEEWSKTILYEVKDPKEIDEHFLHIKHTFKKIEASDLSELVSVCTDPKYDISDKQRRGFALNPFYILHYIEKFDVFVYKDYVEDNPVTRAALSMLESLKNGKSTDSRFVSFSTFMRCIDTLNTFWD